MRARRIVPWLAGLVLVTFAPAGSYELKESEEGKILWWHEMPVEYRLVRGNVPGGASGENAVHRAFTTWEQTSSNVDYDFGGFASDGSQELDYENLVYWIHESWPFDERAAALTFHYYDRKDGRLLDADIVFNGEHFVWTIGGAGFDIENSAAHEVGHFGGLGHSTHSEATMYSRTSSGETGKRTLAPDDVAGFEALYGGTGEAPEAGETGGDATGVGGGGGGGGCSVAKAGSARDVADFAWLGVFLAALAFRSRRRA